MRRRRSRIRISTASRSKTRRSDVLNATTHKRIIEPDENPPAAYRPMLNSSFTRRQLLQIGGIGALGLGLPRLLHAGTRGKERSCIFLCLYGGPSQIDLWDMKPDPPDGIRGPYQPIAPPTPGTHIREL